MKIFNNSGGMSGVYSPTLLPNYEKTDKVLRVQPWMLVCRGTVHVWEDTWPSCSWWICAHNSRTISKACDIARELLKIYLIINFKTLNN
jgi:hypothetical protein